MTKPIIYLDGHSGCNISVVKKTNGLWCVRKKSSNHGYNSRLIEQEKKQKLFTEKINKCDNVFSPIIYDNGYDVDGLYYFDMEYISGYKVSEYFSRIDLDGIKNFFLLIKKYFDQLFSVSNRVKIDRMYVLKKTDDVRSKIRKNIYFEDQFVDLIYKYLINNIPDVDLSITDCHGDLTFSNIIVINRERLCCIDLLDSFLESPIIDIVKIRQDTKFGWSLISDNRLPKYKKSKAAQVYKYLDVLLADYINNINSNDLLWYNYLEVFNLYRIMPYVTNISNRNFLYEKLKMLLI
jgi:hypothetical protein